MLDPESHVDSSFVLYPQGQNKKEKKKKGSFKLFYLVGMCITDLDLAFIWIGSQ